MGSLASIAYLRQCTEADEAFVYDVFCTTWESEVAALPNQNLAQHVLRIQHIAQERRFAGRFPDRQRYVVKEGDQPVGRLYVDETGPVLQVIDLTLMPRVRDRGLGTRIFQDLMAYAESRGLTVRLRIERRNERATMLSTGPATVRRNDRGWHPLASHCEGRRSISGVGSALGIDIGYTPSTVRRGARSPEPMSSSAFSVAGMKAFLYPTLAMRSPRAAIIASTSSTEVEAGFSM